MMFSSFQAAIESESAALSATNHDDDQNDVDVLSNDNQQKSKILIYYKKN